MKLLGIDAGATHVRYGLVMEGKLAQERREKSRIGSPGELAVQCREIVQKFPDASSVGIVTPGPLDSAGVLRAPPNMPGWGTINFKELLAKEIGRPLTYDRDAYAAIVSEWKLGVARGAKNVALLTLGTGIGGAALVEGRILRGHHGFSGEFGHALVGPSGRRCGLKHDGCAEAWASGRAMENGVSVARATDVLARLIMSLDVIFDPEILVLAGGLTGHQEYIDALRGKIDAIGLQTDVKVGKWGEWSGVVGAALLGANQSD